MDRPRADIPAPPEDTIVSPVALKAAVDTQTDSQQAFTAAAKELLAHDRKRALEKYPELVHLP